MKKSILKKGMVIFGALFFAAALFLNSSNAVDASGFDLSSLVSLNSADAECFPGSKTGWPTNHYCDTWGNCTPNGAGFECTP